MMSKTIYFCAGWFTDKQNKAYQSAMTAIKQNPTIDVENSYVLCSISTRTFASMSTQNTCMTRNGPRLPLRATAWALPRPTLHWPSTFQMKKTSAWELKLPGLKRMASTCCW